MLSDLRDCSVWLLGGLSALRMMRLARCRVYGGPVAGATFVEGAHCHALNGYGTVPYLWWRERIRAWVTHTLPI